MRAFLDQPEPLIITKSNARSLVHRRAHMDYVGVKTFDAEGRFNGERRFVGLFTSSAYSLPPRDIPLLRRKMRGGDGARGLAPASHDGKALAHILDTFPRDELFQISEDELFETAMGILRLGGRPKVQAVPALRPFRPFRLRPAVRAARPHQRRSCARRSTPSWPRPWMAGMSASIAAIDDESALVRIHYIIGRNRRPAAPMSISRALEQQIADAITHLGRRFSGSAVAPAMAAAKGLRRLAARARRSSRPAIAASFSPMKRRRDLEILETLAARRGGLKSQARAYRKEADDAHSALRLKLYVLGEVLPLSASLPVFENLGLKVIAEDAYPVSLQARRWLDRGRRRSWIS